MAVADALQLHVSKNDFVERVNLIDGKMGELQNLIDRYGQAKRNLTQFVEEGDSTYQSWCDRIEVNVKACKASYEALSKQKVLLQTTVDQMDGMTDKIKDTVTTGAEAAISTIKAAIKVEGIM